MFRRCAFAVLAFPAICFGNEPFQYGGLSLQSNPATFKEKYPTSITDSKSVWLSAADSHDGVYFIEKRSSGGTESIRMSFEKPPEQLASKPKTWEDGHYLRHPRCTEILSQLTKKYGAPAKAKARWEEAIEWRPYRWSRDDQQLQLNCYTLNGQGKILAADVEISRKAR